VGARSRARAPDAGVYLLFDSPIGPFGPPQPILGGLGTWLLAGVILGAITGAIELYFFPVSPWVKTASGERCPASRVRSKALERLKY
jgi:hypothetical protein